MPLIAAVPLEVLTVLGLVAWSSDKTCHLKVWSSHLMYGKYE